MNLAKEVLNLIEAVDFDTDFDRFIDITEEIISAVKEGTDPDIVKTRSEVEKVRDAMAKLRVTMHKEKELGKADSVLDNLKKQWTALQEKIVKLWAEYDKKHGTKYHLGYAT